MKSNCSNENLNNFNTIKQSVSSHLSDNIKIATIREQENNTRNYSLKLSDRNNVVQNLNQGYYTHCCISMEGINRWSLPGYMVSDNFNIIEIYADDKVVGQAFCYVGSNSKDKAHLVIDNVEINNSYSGDKNLIKTELEEFSRTYRDHIGNLGKNIKIGNAYNDIVVGGPLCSTSRILGIDEICLEKQKNCIYILSIILLKC